MIQKEIKMGEMFFTQDPSIELYTLGVSTCIVFVISGFYIREQATCRFIGLFHWDGFSISVSESEQENYMHDILYDFFDEIKTSFDLKNESIYIENLFFIGGEKAEYGEDNELILSGTEAEVFCVMKAIKDFDFEDEGIEINRNAIQHHHFLTSGDQSLSVFVSSTGVRWLDSDLLLEQLSSTNRGFVPKIIVATQVALIS